MAAQFFTVVCTVKRGKACQKLLFFLIKAYTDLLPFKFGIAQGAQAVAQKAYAAVVEGHGRLPDLFRPGHMALHQRRLQKSLAHLFYKGGLVLADSCFAPACIVKYGFAGEIGITQKKNISERMDTVPVFRPVMHLTEEFYQR